MSKIPARMLYLHALSAVHSGTGQAAAVIDLPIAREKATGWPVIPGSTLKGVLRDALGDGDAGRIKHAFGPDVGNASEHAGALRFGDQHVLLFPARSFHGTFAWLTSPLVLCRYRRDAEAVGLPVPSGNGLAAAGMEALVAQGSAVRGPDGRLLLEDLDLKAAESPELGLLADFLARQLFAGDDERRLFRERLALVSDTVFDFLCETATEISARVRLQDTTKTVASGGLWYEEAVPAEAVFYGPVLSQPPDRKGAEECLALLGDRLVQVGGKASVGKGLCRLLVRGGEGGAP